MKLISVLLNVCNMGTDFVGCSVVVGKALKNGVVTGLVEDLIRKNVLCSITFKN